MVNSINAAIDNLCEEFNTQIGKFSEDSLKNQNKDHKSIFDSFIAHISKEADKAILAYNIKAYLYNVATTVAIVGVAGAIFGSSLYLFVAVAGIAGRLFVVRAMSKTVVGGVDKLIHANGQDLIYGWLFKPLHATAFKS